MRFWVAFPLAALLASCSGFKSGGNGDGGPEGGTMTGDGGTTTEGGGAGTGPGPKGALPSGYCCNSNDECRQRNCIDFGGSKMCADECMTQDACDGALPGLVCVGATQSMYGACQPMAMGTKCVPASQFMYGTKKLGACCTPTWNGANGFECEGGHCGQTLPGPFMCSNACSKASDCPGPFMCSPVGDHYALCIPLDGSQMCTN
jgi:hypothetical protein